jgi:hypothetical protein
MYVEGPDLGWVGVLTQKPTQPRLGPGHWVVRKSIRPTFGATHTASTSTRTYYKEPKFN